MTATDAPLADLAAEFLGDQWADPLASLLFADWLEDVALRPRDAALWRVLVEPWDDGHRLAYAAGVEAEGDRDRAEFVRAQVELAGLLAQQCPTHRDVAQVRDPGGYAGCYDGRCPRCPQTGVLRRREQELLEKHAYDWFEAGRFHDDWLQVVDVRNADGTRHHGGWSSGGQYVLADFRRGFPASITLAAADLLAHAAGLWRAAPVTTVRLSDREPSRTRDRAYWTLEQFGVRPTDSLPMGLFRLLAGGGGGIITTFYPTTAAAHADMSQAAVAFGRAAARLPPLPPVGG